MVLLPSQMAKRGRKIKVSICAKFYHMKEAGQTGEYISNLVTKSSHVQPQN